MQTVQTVLDLQQLLLDFLLTAFQTAYLPKQQHFLPQVRSLLVVTQVQMMEQMPAFRTLRLLAVTSLQLLHQALTTVLQLFQELHKQLQQLQQLEQAQITQTEIF